MYIYIYTVYTHKVPPSDVGAHSRADTAFGSKATSTTGALAVGGTETGAWRCVWPSWELLCVLAAPGPGASVDAFQSIRLRYVEHSGSAKVQTSCFLLLRLRC